MKYLLILLFMWSSAAFADDGTYDYKPFFELKYEVKSQFKDTMLKHFKGEANSLTQLKVSQDLDTRMRELRNKIPFEYSVVSNIGDGMLFVSVVIDFKDEMSSIVWENHAIANRETMQFFTRSGEHEAQSFEDYYRWESLWRNK